jgi:transposase
LTRRVSYEGARIAPSAVLAEVTSKIHAVVDERGLPVRLALTPGQASDEAVAPGLLEGLPAASVVIADRGYDWQHLIDMVGQRGGHSHIPTQRDRKVQISVDLGVYRQRNLVGVERFATRWPGCYFSQVKIRDTTAGRGNVRSIHQDCRLVSSR